MIELPKDLVKVSRKEIARRMLDEDYPIYVIPCKLRLDNMWETPFRITREYLLTNYSTKYGFVSVSFERFIRDYVYYHCNKDTGYYLSYYAHDKDLEAFKEKYEGNEFAQGLYKMLLNADDHIMRMDRK